MKYRYFSFSGFIDFTYTSRHKYIRRCIVLTIEKLKWLIIKINIYISLSNKYHRKLWETEASSNNFLIRAGALRSCRVYQKYTYSMMHKTAARIFSLYVPVTSKPKFIFGIRGSKDTYFPHLRQLLYFFRKTPIRCLISDSYQVNNWWHKRRTTT